MHTPQKRPTSNHGQHAAYVLLLYSVVSLRVVTFHLPPRQVVASLETRGRSGTGGRQLPLLLLPLL